MTQITISEEQAVHIRSASDTIELVDVSGSVLGVVLPPESPESRRSPLSFVELQARRQQTGGKPLSEILNKLREAQ